MPCPRALWWSLWLSPKGASFVPLYKQTRRGFVRMVLVRGWGTEGAVAALSLLISAGFVTQLQSDLLALIWIC